MCKICIARRLVVDIFPWCNANFVPFPRGTLVARRMQNGSLAAEMGGGEKANHENKFTNKLISWREQS